MKSTVTSILASIVLLAPATLASAQSQRLAVDFRVPRMMPHTAVPLRPAVAAAAAAVDPEALDISTQFFSAGTAANGVPMWTFRIRATRDGDHHLGTMVGHSPFGTLGTDRIPTNIVPLIIRTHRVATAFDPNTFVIATAPGETTIDATAADNTCLSAPNNVPARLVRQSPVFNTAHFVFGGTDVGTTQYTDALQRASFWQVLGANANQYHLLLDPVRTREAMVIDVPPDSGLAITDPNFFLAAFGFSICAPLQFVDINWFDSYLNGTSIPNLAREEEGSAALGLPIFLAYEGLWPIGDVTNLFNCCAGGYHSITGYPTPNQPYAVVDFDRSQLFSGPAAGLDTIILAHEVGEWANDPLIVNLVPPWGGTGQVAFCQANLEVGDPLTGTNLPPITMPNGFTYNLQELAFFSWFFGAPSVAVNGWYSDNGTFLTDAGPVCPHH
jgi:hypothetical protein